MKIAIITTHPVQYYAPVFRMLAEKGSLQLKVFYTRGEARLRDKDFDRAIEWDIPLLEGYDYTFCFNSSKKPGRGFWGIINPELVKEINKYKPDALLVYGWNYQSHWQLMRHFKGKISIYFRGDSHLLDEKPGWHTFLRRNFLRYIYRHIDYAFYVGQANRDYFLKHGLREDQLIFAPHAIDNERFADPDGSYSTRAMELKRQLNLPEYHRIILFCGKFVKKKDPVILIRLFNETPPENLSLLMVGNGPLERELKEFSAGNTRIRFLDFQNQSMMPVVYRLGDVLVLPSRGPGETWGLAVNEAMACGRPVVVSDKVGCNMDLVQDNYNGFRFRAGDQGELRNAIIRCVSAQASWQMLANNSNALIQDWSFSKQVGVIEKTITEKL